MVRRDTIGPVLVACWALSAVVVFSSLTGSISLSPSAPATPSVAAHHSASAPVRATETSASGTPSAPLIDAHPGTLQVYEIAPGGAPTVDPSVAYNTASAEPILNVYQTLIEFNGSSQDTFLPELATCVPGPGCVSLYGSTLIGTNGSTGLPQYWTFVIDPHARFYDPSTGASWPVYPSDVMFSLARSLSFTDLPGYQVQPGWIQAQALLPFGNGGWDNGIHAPLNNTPSNVLGSMAVNDSAYCPAIAQTDANGCITFNASGSGHDWPEFLMLVTEQLGASIEPCGWFTAMGAGVPGFPGTRAANGDGPCLLPGNATSTSSAAFRSAVAAMGPEYWDAFQQLANNNPAVQPGVQYRMVGSGPYYEVALSNQSYQLAANPAYAQPFCAGLSTCEPAPGSYVPTVDVHWEPNATAGLAAYGSGTADIAQIDQANSSALVQLAREGKIGFSIAPTLSTYFLPFNLDFNVTLAQSLDPTGGVNVPGNFFASIALRNFVAQAFPYATVNASVNTVDNVTWGYVTGGPIPKFMGNYFPANVSFPTGNPGTDPSVNGSAAWWLAEARNPSSPYYDAELASCSGATPCRFPIAELTGSSVGENAAAQLLIEEIRALTNGSLQPFPLVLTFPQMIEYTIGSPAGQSPLPLYSLGWLPDYPDPTDYLAPMALPNSTFTYPDSVFQTLATPAFENASCGYAQVSSFADLIHWANQVPIRPDCQGLAYETSVYWAETAAGLAPGAQRTLDYNLVEHILNALALYIWYDQATQVQTYAPWIDPASLNTNPMLGGGGIQPWYSVRVLGSMSAITISETGLPSGTAWSFTLGGVSATSTGSVVRFLAGNGSYPFAAGDVAGYTASPSSGNLSVPQQTSLEIEYSPIEPTKYEVTFSESTLAGGLQWSVTFGGVTKNATVPTTSAYSEITFEAGNGTYPYFVTAPSFYLASPSSGTVEVNGAPLGESVTFQGAGDLDLKVQPADAAVTVNGRPIPLANATAQLVVLPGEYFVNATLAGYAPYSNLVSVTVGTTVVVSVVLSLLPAYGYLEGTVTPSTATVTANGVIVPVVNGSFDVSLAPGEYYVSATASGYGAELLEANVTAGAVTRLSIDLAPSPSSWTLQGTVDPRNASVLVNGFAAYVNATGFYEISLTSGTYTLSVSAPGYFPFSENVTLDSNEVIDFVLTKSPSPTSVSSSQNTTAVGYNVTVTGVAQGNGSISVTYAATVNGTLVVMIPYRDVANATLEQILASRVYINGVRYTNFTVALTADYSVELTVYGLSGDPTLFWGLTPGAAPARSTTTPPSSPTIFGIPLLLFEVGVVAAVLGGATAAVLAFRRRGRRPAVDYGLVPPPASSDAPGMGSPVGWVPPPPTPPPSPISPPPLGGYAYAPGPAPPPTPSPFSPPPPPMLSALSQRCSRCGAPFVTPQDVVCGACGFPRSR